jgi:PAS domain S-box-containing protein
LVIQRNATTLLKHVNDLLDLSKLDAGRHTVDYAQVNLARQVRAGAAHFDALAPQRSLSYVVTTPDALRAEVDPEKFDRVLLNLLSNAFKFTPAGGRIRCGLEVIGSGRVLLTVQDSGPGIKLEARATIFERFRQAQTGATREFGGTGLGLAIARDFADLHGGSIAVSDAPGISLRDIAIEEDREVVTSRIAELRDGARNGYCDECQYRRRDGSCGWARVSVSVVPGSDLAPRMLVGVFDDTTARKRAEDEQKKLASLVENGTDCIGMASFEGQ